MLNRKTAAKSASSLFFEEYNDVDIYIEDTAEGYRKIFKEILNNALGAKFCIEQVFPLGDRKQVINECEKNQTKSGRKKVFIIDGDLHLLNNDPVPELKGLFVLPRYCVENYLFCENALITIADEEEAELDSTAIKEKLDFKLWVSENENLLLELFIVYAICFKYIPQVQTVGYKVSKLCNSSSGIVCPEKINFRIKELKDKLIEHFGEIQLRGEIEMMRERINKFDNKLIRFVSGKDYLFPLITARLQSILRFPSISIAIKLKLAKKSKANELEVIEKYFHE